MSNFLLLCSCSCRMQTLPTVIAFVTIACVAAVQLNLRGCSQSLPNNVYVEFQLQPAGELADFGVLDIREKGSEHSWSESSNRTIHFETAVLTYVHILVDQSSSVQVRLALMKSALDSFVAALLPGRFLIALSYFRGERDLFPFPGSDAARFMNRSEARAAIRAFEGAVCPANAQNCDPSTNLRGAMIHGLQLLDSHILPSEVNASRAIVVLTDGVERAHRYSLQDRVAAFRLSTSMKFRVRKQALVVVLLLRSRSHLFRAAWRHPDRSTRRACRHTVGVTWIVGSRWRQPARRHS